MLGAADRIVRRGRARGFRVMMISQRPAALNKNLLSQANVLIAMKLPGPQDRKAVEDWIRGQADINQASKMLASLAGLPRGEGWVWAPERNVLRRHKVGAIKTFDSMKAPEHGETISEPTSLAPVELGDLRALLVDEPAPSNEGAKINMAPSKADLDAAEQRGYDRARRALAEEMLTLFEGVRAEHAQASHAVGEVFTRFLGRIESRLITARSVAAPPPEELPKSRAVAAPPLKKELPAPTQRPASDLHPGAVKLLQVLARGAMLTWGQAATLAGLKAKGGHFNAARRIMRDRRLIEETQSGLRITDSGLAILGLTEPPAMEHADLLAWWLEALPTASARLLRELLEHPHGLTKRQLGKKLGLATYGGHWNFAVAILKQNNLIIIDGEHFAPAL
jgi:hypothetical protein